MSFFLIPLGKPRVIYQNGGIQDPKHDQRMFQVDGLILILNLICYLKKEEEEVKSIIAGLQLVIQRVPSKGWLEQYFSQ